MMRTLKAAIYIGFIAFLFTGCSEKPEANFTWSPKEPKAGEEVQFTNLSTGAKKYSWNLGDMTISSETHPKHTYQKEGNYIVDLSASRGLRSDMKTATITVLP